MAPHPKHFFDNERSEEQEDDPYRQQREETRQYIEAQILEKTIRWEGEQASESAFVTDHKLKKLWTLEQLERFFKGFDWADGSTLQTMHGQSQKVLSTLIRIGWADWKNFKRYFIDRPGRQDKNLPFVGTSTWSDCPFSMLESQDFETHQSTFLPITIIKDEDQEYSCSYRMPFLQKSVLISKKGSYGTIHRDVIARYQYQKRGGKPDANEITVVRKSCELTNISGSLRDEIETLSKFRKVRTLPDRIMTSLGTVKHGDFLHIFFPVAMYDLDDLLYKKASSTQSMVLDRMTLIDMASELASLAEALEYLHGHLHLSGGEHEVCVHHDLKPDNILVVYDRESKVGRFKITDFGLSRIKRSKQVDDIYEGIDYFSSVRNRLTSPSNTSPKRKPGAFQAPEIEKQGKKVVGPKSDVWSMGCIWILVLSYMIGGESCVKEFDCCRSRLHTGDNRNESYWNDYFYRNEEPEVNSEVLDWLQKVQRSRPEGEDWVRSGVCIALRVLQIDESKRPSAGEVHQAIFDDVVQRLLKLTDPALEDELKATRMSCMSKQEQVPDIQPTDLPQGPTTTASMPAQVPDLLSAEFQPYPGQRSTAISSRYIQYTLPNTKVIKTSLSASCQLVAFLSESDVYVCSMKAMESQLWNTYKRRAKISDESEWLKITVDTGYRWLSMSFSDRFLAVRGFRPDSNQYVVRVFLIGLNEKDQTITAEAAYTSEKQGLMGILSSNAGYVALQYDSFIKVGLATPGSRKLERKFSVTGHVKSYCFTQDGKWLVAWSTDNRKNYCSAWELSNPETCLSGTIRPQPPQSSYGLEEAMIEFARRPDFIVFDRAPGQVRIVQGLFSPPGEEKFFDGLHPNINTGKVTRDSNAVILIRNGRDITFTPLSMAANGAMRPGATTKLGRLGAEISHTTKLTCDLGLRTDEQSGALQCLFIAHKDGLIEKVEVQYDES